MWDFCQTRKLQELNFWERIRTIVLLINSGLFDQETERTGWTLHARAPELPGVNNSAKLVLLLSVKKAGCLWLWVFAHGQSRACRR